MTVLSPQVVCRRAAAGVLPGEGSDRVFRQRPDHDVVAHVCDDDPTGAHRALASAGIDTCPLREMVKK